MVSEKHLFWYPIEYARSNHVLTSTWFSQIDYGIEALIKQYNRFLQGKRTDWRLPVDVLSIRFEGVSYVIWWAIVWACYKSRTR